MDARNVGAAAPTDLPSLLKRVAQPDAPLELIYAVLGLALDPAVPVDLLYTLLARARRIREGSFEANRGAPTTPAALRPAVPGNFL